MVKFELVPYSEHVIIRLEMPSMEEWSFEEFDSNYVLHSDSIEIKTIAEDVLDWGKKGKVQVYAEKINTRNEYEKKFTFLNIQKIFVVEAFLWNQFCSSYLSIVSDYEESPETEESLISISENCPAIKIAIFKNKKEDADEIQILILENVYN